MARPITVQFGLLSFPGKADKATVTKEPMSNLCPGQPGHDAHEPSPLRQPKVCETCGPIVDYDVLVKGIKRGSTYAIVEQSDVAEAKAEFTKEYLGVVNLVAHPAAEFLAETAPGESVNFITPADAAGANIYQLLVKLIESHPELAFASLHTPKSATNLFQMTVRNGVLVLEQRARSQSLKATPSVGGTINDALYAMLDAQLEALVTPYDADAYEDKYAAAVDAMAETAKTVTMGSGKMAAVAGLTNEAELFEKLRLLQEAS